MTSLQIQYFLAAAEYSSFSRAAEYHYTSQPSISRQMSSLERELGFALFERDSRGVQLTQEGKLLYEELSLMAERFRLVLEQARSSALSKNAELKIGYLKETNISVIMPFIQKFSKKYPHITLNFEGYGFQDLYEKLIKKSLDIAFMHSYETENIPFINQKPIFSSSAYIVVSANDPLAAKESPAPEDFAEKDIVVSAESSKGASFAVSQCENYGFSPKKIITSATSEAVRMYIELRSCIAVMDSSNRFFYDTVFRFIEISGGKAKSSLNAVWRKDNSNPAIALFDSECLPA